MNRLAKRGHQWRAVKRVALNGAKMAPRAISQDRPSGSTAAMNSPHVIPMKTAVPSHSFTRLIMNRERLGREWYGSRSGERAGEAGQDAEVGVKRDLLKPANSDRASAAVSGLKPRARIVAST